MRKLKNFVVCCLAVMAVLSLSLFFVACDNGDNGADINDTQIVSVYNLYVAYAEDNGETPLSYDEWLSQIKGEKGEKGDKGDQGIQGEKGEKGDKGDNGKDGVNGIDGLNGKDGLGIKSVVKTSTDGLIDTYTITYSDDTTSTFTITNGKNGVQGEKGDKGDQGIQGEKGDKGDQGIQGEKGDKGDQGIQGEKGDKGDQGIQGEDGSDGKSAYELYKETYGYEKSEEEWLFDLVNGNLALKQTYTVEFDSDGGTEIGIQHVSDGKKAVKPAVPEKDGCVFKGWYLGGDEWNFLYCTVSENTVLKAKWIQVEYETNAGDKDDIDVMSENQEITLMATHNAGYTWLGWYVGDEKVSQGNSYTVTFNQKDSDKVYTAKFAKITVKKNVDAGNITTLNGKYFVGDNTTLTATVNDGYIFKGWYKNGEKVSLDGELDYELIFGTTNETYTATYIANPVTVEKNISEAGKVSKQNTGVIGGDYTVNATTNDGYTWLGWYVGENKVSVGDSLTYTFALTETPVTLTAKWAEYTVTLNKNYDKAGTLSGGGRTAAGKSATVKAVNDYSEYFTFDGWYNGETKVSSLQNYTFDMPKNNISLTAKWNLKSNVQAITTASELNAIDGTKTYILLNDISLSGITFTSKEISANGVLDGLGYRIKNVKITSNSNFEGIFKTNNGQLKNIKVEGCTVKGKAVFVGDNYGIITNCEVNDSTLTSNGSSYMAIFTSINYGHIYNSKTSSTINYESSYGSCAGFVCKNAGTIKNSYSSDKININVSPDGNRRFGAFSCSCDDNSVIENCYSSTNILGSVQGWKYAFGSYTETVSTAKLKNCFFTGNIVNRGDNYFAPDFHWYLKAENCYTSSNFPLANAGIPYKDISNFYNKSFVTNTIGFKEYGKGTVANGYVWVFEDNKLPKLYWE